MQVFPQLLSGSLAQYPLRKRQLSRTVINQTRDGRTIKLDDPDAAGIEWRLSYQALSDAELDTLQESFSAAEGRLKAFTFLDPTANLLTWSEKLDEPVWQGNTLLQLQPGVPGPAAAAATRLINTTAASVAIQQNVNAPGWFVYTFSVYARSDTPGNISVFRQAGTAIDERTFALRASWSRFVSSGSLQTAAESMTIGVIVSAGQTVDIGGLQLEPQPGAATYKSTTSTSGIYSDAHFAEDAFVITTDAPNQHRCMLTVTSLASH